MHELISKIKPHRPAIFVALALGALTLAGPLIGSWRTPGFAGVYKIVSDDEAYYLARVQEAAQGRCAAVSPFLHEYKDALPVAPFAAECVIGIAARLTGISVPTLFLILDFLLPMVASLLIYVLMLQLTESRLGALAAMIALHAWIFFEEMNRPISPQLNVLIFLAGMLALLWWLREKSWRATALCAVLLAGQMYTYFYYWTFMVVWCGALGLYFLYRRAWRVSAQFICVVASAAVLAAPYFFNTWHATQQSWYAETVLRWGLIESRIPSGLFIMIAVATGLAALGITHLSRLKKISFEKISAVLFLVTGLVAVVVVSNHHVLTNKNLLFASHYLPQAIYLMVGALTVALARGGAFTNKRVAPVVLGFVCIGSVVTIVMTLNKQLSRDEHTITAQRYAPLVAWLNEHTPADSVVYTNDLLTYLVPAYTHNNVLHGFMASMTPAPTQDLQQRFLVAHYEDALTDNFIRVNQYWLVGAVCLVRPQNEECINGSRLFGPVRAQQEVVRSRPLLEWLRQYGVQYMVIDRASDPAWKFAVVARMPKLFSEQGVEVYRME